VARSEPVAETRPCGRRARIGLSGGGFIEVACAEPESHRPWWQHKCLPYVWNERERNQ
jgi:hypothetical protein